MPTYESELNELLEDIYRNVRVMEEKDLKKSRLNLSIGEMHLLEQIGKGQNGMTVSEIAQKQNVTKPSVTVAVNKLVQKGYCEKQHVESDGRAVLVTLTKLGRRVNAFHARFHRNMIREVTSDLTETEQEKLLEIMGRLNHYFQSKL